METSKPKGEDHNGLVSYVDLYPPYQYKMVSMDSRRFHLLTQHTRPIAHVDHHKQQTSEEKIWCLIGTEGQVHCPSEPGAPLANLVPAPRRDNTLVD